MAGVTDSTRNGQQGLIWPGNRTAPGASKEDWLRIYTDRVLQSWRRRRAPLGLAPAYARWVREDLAAFYGQPLMKAFIERTYNA
jgi:hypothetical protein